MGRFTAALLLAFAAGCARGQDRPNRTAWEAQQAASQAAADGAVAKEKKMDAVNKAVELLERLRTKVAEEGEAEAKTYNKFACFCKDTTAQKLEEIEKGSDEKASLAADLGSLQSRREDLDASIQATQEDIATHEKAIATAREERKKSLDLYQLNSQDMKDALEALEGAIQSLRASRAAPSFAQLRSVAQTLRQATLLADALGLLQGADAKALAFLQQEPANDVQMEDYKFHSEGVIKMLENLLDKFRAERTDMDKAEADSVHTFEVFVQTKTDEVKALSHELEERRKARAQAVADTEAASQRLTTVAATLLDDKDYANKLSQMCGDKAKTWDQRSRVRAAELQTLTQAVSIIRGAVTNRTSAATVRLAQQAVSIRVAKALAASPQAMAAIEAEAEDEEAAPAFLQQRSALAAVRRLRGGASPEAGKAVIVSLLKSKGEQLKSTLLTSLASEIAKDPFAKVKQLIQELIERLLQEAGNEANQKGWCDKAISEAKQKRGYAADEVRRLNAEMANLEVVRDQLSQELGTLATEIQELKDNRAKAESERSEESLQNKATIQEAQDGLTALNMCIDLLDKFYKTIAKESVDLSLAQAGPEDDAPDAGFGNGEAYLGGQSESGGILAMLEVMRTDFTRTVQETNQAEAQAVQDHLEFMTETGKSLASKQEAESAKTGQLDDTKAKLGEAEETFQTQSSLLVSAVQQLLELQPVCVNTGMSYEDRVSRREEELAALNKAMCILEKYAEYGPDGAANSC